MGVKKQEDWETQEYWDNEYKKAQKRIDSEIKERNLILNLKKDRVSEMLNVNKYDKEQKKAWDIICNEIKEEQHYIYHKYIPEFDLMAQYDFVDVEGDLSRMAEIDRTLFVLKIINDREVADYVGEIIEEILYAEKAKLQPKEKEVDLSRVLKKLDPIWNEALREYKKVYEGKPIEFWTYYEIYKAVKKNKPKKKIRTHSGEAEKSYRIYEKIERKRKKLTPLQLLNELGTINPLFKKAIKRMPKAKENKEFDLANYWSIFRELKTQEQILKEAKGVKVFVDGIEFK